MTASYKVIVPSGGDDGPMLSGLTMVTVCVGAFKIGSNAKVMVPIVAYPSTTTFKLQKGVVLSFDGGLVAPMRRQLFINATAGGGVVVFAPNVGQLGFPEWWGARCYQSQPERLLVPFDSTEAINACIAACAITDCSPGVYYHSGTIEILQHNRVVRGAGATQQPYRQGLSRLSSLATQFVNTSARQNSMFVGIKSLVQPEFLLEFVTVQDIALYRATAQVPLAVSNAAPIANPSAGVLPCPTGVSCNWIVNCHFDRVMTVEHSNGFYLWGCVECYWNNCSALRATSGAEPSNDRWSGFYLDYSAPLSANGGNASIYLTDCRAFSGAGRGEGGATYTAGLTTSGGFVDLFITRMETGLTHFGLDFSGTGGAVDARTEDLHVTDCILDSPVTAGLRIRDAGPQTAVEIRGLYTGLAAGATGVSLSNVGGAVAIIGSQYIGGGATGMGLSAAGPTTLVTSGCIHTNLASPVSLAGMAFCDISDAIHVVNAAFSDPAIKLVNCQRCVIRPTLSGVAGRYACGVSLDAASAHNQVEATRIDPGVVGSAANKIIYAGVPWGGGPTFGVGNIATGVLN